MMIFSKALRGTLNPIGRILVVSYREFSSLIRVVLIWRFNVVEILTVVLYTRHTQGCHKEKNKKRETENILLFLAT